MNMSPINIQTVGLAGRGCGPCEQAGTSNRSIATCRNVDVGGPTHAPSLVGSDPAPLRYQSVTGVSRSFAEVVRSGRYQSPGTESSCGVLVPTFSHRSGAPPFAQSLHVSRYNNVHSSCTNGRGQTRGGNGTRPTTQGNQTRSTGQAPRRLPFKIAFAKEGKDVVWICLWGDRSHTTTPEMWKWLQKNLPRPILDGILKVYVRTQGRTGTLRMDILIDKEQFDTVFQALKHKALPHWHIRRSVPWSQRQRRHMPPNPRVQEVQSQRATFDKGQVFLSININSAGPKRHELDALMFNQKCQVACIQETLMAKQGWTLRLNGYIAHNLARDEGNGNKGNRGLSVLVHESWPSYLLKKEAHGQCLWVRIFPSWAPQGIVVGNVYIGHTRQRRGVLKSIFLHRHERKMKKAIYHIR